MGDRFKALQRARALLQQRGFEWLRGSCVYETEPVGHSPDERGVKWYLNAVNVFETSHSPEEVLHYLKSVERAMGRPRVRRTNFYTSRVIDLDLLFYDDMVLSNDALILPHPHLHERIFVLQPLVDVASDFVHPVLQKTVSALLALQR